MYKPAKPIRCPSCGEIVQVDTSMILTSNPPQYKWECPKCGRTGTTSSKDIIAFENQKPMRTSGYIQKIDEPDLGVGVTTTNAEGITIIDMNPAISATNTKCTICGEVFGFDGEHRICPKCREAVLKVRKDIYDAQHCIPSDGGRLVVRGTVTTGGVAKDAIFDSTAGIGKY